MNELIFKNGLHIKWNGGDDGGGSTQYADFLEVISDGRTYKKGLEWCAGLSAIAFSLMDAKIIENCVLMDIYEPALTTAMENALRNNIGDKIKYYVCDSIKKLPDTEKFDLVVSNPPHSKHGDWINENNELVDVVGGHRRLSVDKDWKLHEEFFSSIPHYLNEGADIFLSESDTHMDLIEMALKNKLQYVGSYPAPELAKCSNTYAVIMHFRYETKIY